MTIKLEGHRIFENCQKFDVPLFMLPIVQHIQVSQNWRTNYLLPYRECLNVHEKNMEKTSPTKKSIIFIIIIINGNKQ
jgi:hypothetical protein